MDFFHQILKPGRTQFDGDAVILAGPDLLFDQIDTFLGDMGGPHQCDGGTVDLNCFDNILGGFHKFLS